VTSDESGRKTKQRDAHRRKDVENTEAKPALAGYDHHDTTVRRNSANVFRRPHVKNRGGLSPLKEVAWRHHKKGGADGTL